MPSLFEQQFASQLDAMYAQFGIEATYTAPNGTSVDAGIDGNPLLLRIHRNDAHQVDKTARVAGELQTSEVMVQQSKLAKPVKGGRFAVEGVEVWTIETTPTLKNGEYLCSCSRSGVERMGPARAKE